MKTDIQTIGAEKAGTVDLADHIFGLEPRADLIHRVVLWQLAKRQAGTHKTKVRSGNQSHRARSSTSRRARATRVTARAVQASSSAAARLSVRAPRSHEIDLPKKLRALGLRHALSSKVKASTLMIIDKAEIERGEDQVAEGGSSPSSGSRTRSSSTAPR